MLTLAKEKTRQRERGSETSGVCWRSHDIAIPILYGVWYTKEGSVGGRILRNGRAIVMQWGRLCRWGGSKRMIDSHNKA